MPTNVTREWLAVRGTEIVARGGKKAQARRAAHELGEEFDEIAAVPKGGVHGVF